MYMGSLTAGADPGASTLEAVDLLQYLMKVLSPQQRAGPNAAMGFVSVIITSALFLLALPLVLF